MDTKTLLCIAACAVAVVIIGYFVYKRYYPSQEGYLSSPLSSTSGLTRSPVTYTYVGDGMSANPQYQASYDDRTIPLEYGGFDPYKRVVNKMQKAPLLRGEMTDVLVNDGKLRMDMVETGNFGEFTILNNQFTPAHKKIDGDWTYDFQAAVEDAQGPLYHPVFFEYDILGRGS